MGKRRTREQIQRLLREGLFLKTPHFSGVGGRQLRGEQLQYAVVTRKPREQEFTHGHGSPAATDSQ